jgi:lipopolysaccharide transport system ATP-binding protein
VASLLEVGTGFHPELTGRENVFLNGSILGMTRAEIRASFDAIVAFAEIERFLDTPVKRYSSGMYVRLAFAVAAHLTPEILIVDEVLAVGDHEFQRRCLGRMSAVAHGGRTVLFVSHNLRAVEDLCPRTLLLRGGRIERLGPTREVVAHYLARRAGEGQTQAPGIIDVGFVTDREGTGRARLTRLELMDAEGTCRLERATFGQSFRIRWHYTAEEPVPGAALGFSILSENNVRLFTTSTDDHGLEVFSPGHQGHVDCLVRAPNLLPGSYRFDAWITDPVERLYADHVPFFGALEIARGGAAGSAAHWDRQDRGILHLDCAWLIEGTRG